MIDIARSRWRDWGYTSPEVAAYSVTRGLRANGFAVRDRGAAQRVRREQSGGAVISAAALREATAEHEAGVSLHGIARRRSREWGYASPASARGALREAMRKAVVSTRARPDVGAWGRGEVGLA